MKNFILIIAIILCTFTLSAQVPQGFNYQGVARNSDGNPISESSITVRIAILNGSVTVWQEDQIRETSALGLFSLVIGDESASKTGGTASAFSDIDWSSGDFSIKPSINTGSGFVALSTSPLMSVPFALYAEKSMSDMDEQTLALDGSNLTISNGNTLDLSPLQDGGNDGDTLATNEIQDLSLEGGILSLSADPTPDVIDLTDFFTASGSWLANTDTLYTNSSVGIGTSTPNQSLLSVQSNDPQVDKPLFEVLNDIGNPVFAVYNDGVIVYVDEDKKGVKGGFAVGGYNSASKGITQEFMRITPDSVRIWVPEDTPAKGTKGGFAVGGYSSASKAISQNLLEVTSTNTSIYFDTTVQFKGQKGGFAVGGYSSASKGTSDQLLSLTRENYLIGKDAGSNITTGKNNTFFGWRAGLNNTSGDENIFIGRFAGLSNIGAEENIFIGNESGYSTESGYGNIYLGNKSGYSNTEGFFNSIIGDRSGYYTNSNYNTFIGYQAGGNNTTGEANISIGFEAGIGLPIEGEGVSGDDNVFIGYSTGASTTSGNSNIMIGSYSGYFNSTGENNVFIGTDAGYNNNMGNNNVMIGYEAGYNTTGEGEIWAGNYNVFLGYLAGYTNVSGGGNVFLGYYAGYASDSGDYLTAIGHLAGGSAGGSWNTFLGAESGRFSYTGDFNTYLGIYAGKNSTGDYNTYLGQSAGRLVEDGDQNVLIGVAAGEGTAGFDFDYNTYLGAWAGYNTSSGSNNVLLGNHAGYSLTDGSGNVFLGYYAGYNETGSNKLYIANSDTDFPLIKGDFSSSSLIVTGNMGINTGSFTNVGLTVDSPLGDPADWAVYGENNIYSAGAYYTLAGGYYSKSALTTVNNAVSRLKQINGIYYDVQSKSGSSITKIGLIGEEVEEVFPELVKKNKAGNAAVNYDGLVPVLVEAIKEQQAQIEAQQKEIDALKDALDLR